MPGGYTYARLRAALAKRVKAVPEFRMKLADSQLNLDHPVWLDDEDFQLRRHLHRVGVPPPGGTASWPRSAGTLPGCR
jgi:diacylglycerol O-acyltransferase / wax synthase